MRFSKSLVAAAVLALGGASSLSAFTITSGSFTARASDAIGAEGQQLLDSTLLPLSTSLTAVDGASSSTLTIDHQGSGDDVTLSFGLDQTRTGAFFSYSTGYGYLTFTVSADTTYAISGNFAATDVNGAGDFSLTSELFDTNDTGSLFFSNQYSSNTTNESFVLGGSGADIDNYLAGTLTGQLFAGRTYGFFFGADSAAYPDADGGVTAKGGVTLKIGNGAPVASVPDSGGSLGLLMLGLAALAGARRRLASR